MSDTRVWYEDLLVAASGKRYATVLADPPWQFQNRTGKMASASTFAT